MKEASKLFNRNFFLLWQGQVVSQLGSQAYIIALMFLIKHETGSASLMGLVMTVTLLPAVILGPFAGTFADHVSRRKIIVVSDILRGIAVLTLSLSLFFLPLSSNVTITLLFVVSILLGIIRAFFVPAVTAAIPDIVPKERVSSANSLMQSSNQVVTFVGQAIGGYLFLRLGASLLFLIDGVTYLLSAVSESFMEIPQAISRAKDNWREKAARFMKDTGEGFEFAWQAKGIRALFFTASFMNFFLTPIVVLLPFYVEDVLNVAADWYGYMLSGFGFGSLIGYTIAGTVKVTGKMRKNLLLLSLILMSLCLPCLGFVTTAPTAVLVMLIMGCFNAFFNINIFTLLQTTIPSEIRGRIFGLLSTLTSGLTPIAMGLAGIFADLMNQNIPLLYFICGSVTVFLSIISTLSKAFRNFLQTEV